MASDNTLVVVMLLWAVIGGAVGWQIGKSKAREGAGMLLGLFLGPLGWLLVAAGPDLRTKPESEVAAPRATKRCPECAEEILFEARKCKHCGSEIAA